MTACGVALSHGDGKSASAMGWLIGKAVFVLLAVAAWGDETMVVRGRVVDAKGEGVAGAHVHLGPEFLPLPATGNTIDGSQRWVTVVSGLTGEYSFTVEPERRRRPDAHAVFAVHDGMVSQRIVIDRSGESDAIADLMLATGVMGRVRVVWDDGSPGSGVALEVFLSEPTAEGADARTRHYSFEGVTDERGEVSFGPIRDLRYDRIAVRASHPDGLAQFPWWDGQRVFRTPIEVKLSRGRVVRGRLLTADGQPAACYRIAPLGGGETGDPEMARIATTDAQGRFEVKGVGSPTGAIVIYDCAPEPGAGDMRPRRVKARSNLFPLLIQSVVAGCTEVESIRIPRLGSLTIRLEDATGKPVGSGSAVCRRSEMAHGGIRRRVGEDGMLRLERLPLGVGIALHLEFVDSQYGELEQAFEIREVREEAIVLRATGAGTVVFRLHPMGAPDRPLAVSYVTFGENEHHGDARDGPVSELRWWTRPGVYGSLYVAAKGFRERRIENVEVRDGGPTFLDVELEPR